MHTIRFTDNYPKLHNQKVAKLLEVLPIHIENNNFKELIDYDCLMSDGDYYDMSDGDYVQLIFIGLDKRIPFCTIRVAKKNGEDRLEYWKEFIGETFEIKIVEDKKKPLSYKRWHMLNHPEDFPLCNDIQMYEEVAKGMQRYLEYLNYLQNNFPEEAKKEATENLTRVGVLNSDGTLNKVFYSEEK